MFRRIPAMTCEAGVGTMDRVTTAISWMEVATAYATETGGWEFKRAEQSFNFDHMAPVRVGPGQRRANLYRRARKAGLSWASRTRSTLPAVCALREPGAQSNGELTASGRSLRHKPHRRWCCRNSLRATCARYPGRTSRGCCCGASPAAPGRCRGGHTEPLLGARRGKTRGAGGCCSKRRCARNRQLRDWSTHVGHRRLERCCLPPPSLRCPRAVLTPSMRPGLRHRWRRCRPQTDHRVCPRSLRLCRGRAALRQAWRWCCWGARGQPHMRFGRATPRIQLAVSRSPGRSRNRISISELPLVLLPLMRWLAASASSTSTSCRRAW